MPMTSIGSADPGTLVPPPKPTAIPALDNTYGALMLGTFLGLVLYGVILHQGYRYLHLRASKADSTYTKCMVAFVLVIETWHCAISTHQAYYYLVSNYFSPAALFHGVWSVNLIPVSTGLIIAVIHSFFAHRLWMIDRRFRPYVVIIAILMLGELALTIAESVQAFLQPDLVKFENSATWMFDTSLGMAVLDDGMLTTLLTLALRRSRTGFRSTDSKLNILMKYTINTGLFTG
ncbi:hypothetical protein C8Q77DRAFT_631030 [Trametes polyzona]|nr:hypothetical protein C8Q77DRAFT_631030 [Trametes polyzona]